MERQFRVEQHGGGDWFAPAGYGYWQSRAGAEALLAEIREQEGLSILRGAGTPRYRIAERGGPAK